MQCVILSLVALDIILLAPSVYVQGCSSETYGDIMLLKPTGMKNGGVARSQHEINYTLSIGHLRPSKECYTKVAYTLCVHPALIAAIASRESNFGDAIIKRNGWGDCYTNATTNVTECYGYGIMQCDKRYDPVRKNSKGVFNCTTFKWDTCEDIAVLTMYVLITKIKLIREKFPSWKPEQQIQGGVAAYNTGVGRVTSWDAVDKHTTGHDYSNDVLARAQFLVNAKHCYTHICGNFFDVRYRQQRLTGGVAAYNTGVGRVTSWDAVDKHTTGHDYSNYVLARAKFLVNAKHW